MKGRVRSIRLGGRRHGYGEAFRVSRASVMALYRPKKVKQPAAAPVVVAPVVEVRDVPPPPPGPARLVPSRQPWLTVYELAARWRLELKHLDELEQDGFLAIGNNGVLTRNVMDLEEMGQHVRWRKRAAAGQAMTPDVHQRSAGVFGEEG